ncbi:MAG: 3-isopropylmalate dehydratase small subunit [Candidatus Thorarchaeota archaeon]
MRGKVIKYDKKNINTDLIIPARYLIKSDPDYLAEHCMEDLDPEFNQKIKETGATILVAGANFGCGSSREQAPIAIKGTGIKCIIASYYARIFFRNAINIGLPIIEFANVDEINTGDELDVHSEKGIIKNITTNNEFKIKKMPSFIQEIISADGLVNFARNKILKKG